MGSLAGEVQNPKRTFFVGTLLTMLLVTITYALPVFSMVQVGC